MNRRIVIAGASGFIGSYLTRAFRSEGAVVSTIGRSGDATWGDTAAIRRLIDGSDMLVNLAGKSVNCRYTPANRSEIMRSRIETTRELADAVAAASAPPPLWFNSSTATIYRHAMDRPMTDATGEIGEGFSVGIAAAWEREFFAAELPVTRRVALRMAIVLGDGSALTPLLRLARFGLGGPQLDGHWFANAEKRAAGAFHEYRPTHGRQMFSWVHIDDVLAAIRFFAATEGIDGVVNVSSPHPLPNNEVMATLRSVVGAPFGIPMPRVMLEAGTLAIGSETELVLKSRWVVPSRLLEAGFTFTFPELGPAIRDITRKESR